MVTKGQFLKQDMLVYFNTFHINKNGEKFFMLPHCLGIMVSESIPALYGSMGLSFKETLGILAFKQYKEIRHFEHHLIIMN
jgi:hypothetical protein